MSSKKEKYWCARVRDEFAKNCDRVRRAVSEEPNGAGEHCDLYVEFSTGEKVRLESKGAWPTYLQTYGKSGNIGKYKTYLLHPLDPSVSRDNKSAGLDLQRLATLTPPTASHIGLFLMGSQKGYNIKDDFERFANLGCLDCLPWETRTTT